MNKYDHIFLDFDGTLVDTGPGIIKATHYALLNYGIDEQNTDILRCFVGPPLAESFSRYYGFPESQSIEAIMKFREYYWKTGWTESEIYPGAKDMLDRLKAAGKHLYIATGKPEPMCIKIAERYGILDYFDCICGAYVDEEGEHRTNKKEIIETIFADKNIDDRDSCIMIGDRANDINGAHLAGIKAIGALWGYSLKNELSEAAADYTATSPQNAADMIINGLL